MKTPSPYRSLPVPRRVALVEHAIRSGREVRMLWVQRLVAKGRGYRAATLQALTPDRLATEVVRMNAETPQDELDLLQVLFVEREPAVQMAFLDAAGVRHANGVIPEDLEPPYTDAEGVQRGVAAVRAAHGEDGERYLRTLARYFREGWPGIEDAAGPAA